MKFLFVLMLSLLSEGANTLEIQITRGNCSPIINISLADKTQVEAIFGPPPYSFERILDGTLTALRCTERTTKDVTSRLKALLFAIDQVIVLKEEFITPAFDAYQKELDNVQLHLLTSYFREMTSKLEIAINDYVSLRAQGATLLNEREAIDLRNALRDKHVYASLWDPIRAREEYDQNLSELKRQRGVLSEKISRQKR